MSEGLEGIIAGQSSISSIIGKTLTYRGIAIEELAEKANFEEVVYLLWFGRLPNSVELSSIKAELYSQMKLSNNVKKFLKELPSQGNKMEILRTCVSALPLHDNATEEENELIKDAVRIQSQVSSLVAAISRHSRGEKPIDPLEGLDFAENFFYMLNGQLPTELEAETINKALILHADHELNASTFSSRVTVATLSDIYSGMTSAIGTLKGPLHGGANEQVMNMLLEIGNLEDVEDYIDKKLKMKEKIMGIGHRVYRDGDPRATILKDLSKKLTAQVGEEKWYDMSLRIEEIIVKEKGLKPNVDFYSASVYHSMGIAGEMFTPIFAVSRTSGWVAHMLEQYENNRLIRPRAEYVGLKDQTYTPIDKR